MSIPCMSPNSIIIPSFICGCTLVSEIREFNQEKKKKMLLLLQLYIHLQPENKNETTGYEKPMFWCN